MQSTLPDKELAKVMAWLAEKMRCPLCGYRYNLERIRVVPRRVSGREDVLMHTNCGECNCCLMFALDIRGGEVFLVGVVTDLTHQDALRFQGLSSISADEVLEWHHFWRNFNGDLAKALG
jgi:hypothetical protein